MIATETTPTENPEIVVDVGNHALFPIVEAIERVTGYRPSPPTAWRWKTKGIDCGASGRVKLPCVRIGHRQMTSLQAVTEFIRRQSASRAPAVGSIGRSEDTSQQLKAAGLL